MRLPEERGPLTGAVRRLLREDSPSWIADHQLVEHVVAHTAAPLTDLDFQLALTCCYELHYRGFSDVDDIWEWSPQVVMVQSLLEQRLEAALRDVVCPTRKDAHAIPVHEALRTMVAADARPSLSAFLLKSATAEHFRQFLVQRSMYNLKEADPHTWQIPRLAGAAKAALVAIQSDEYGNGRESHMHANMFGQSMRVLGLDETYGAYWADALPETHASVNVMSLFGLHRRHRGALVGHLAALEMTSTEPNRRYGNGLRRLGFGPDATAYFDEHVEADAVHEQIAAVDMCGALVRAEPALYEQVLWGAAACLYLDQAVGAALLRRWDAVPSLGAAP